MRAGTATPADLGDIVSEAVSLCAHRATALVPMAVITVAGSELLSLGMQALVRYLPQSPNASLKLTSAPPPAALLLLAGFPIVLFNQLAFDRFAFDHWAGPGGRVLPAYAAALRRYLPALVASVITVLVFAVGFATWLGIPVAIYFLVCWSFAGQVCAVEGETNPVQALRRSRAIVLGAWWRTAAVLIAILLLSLLPSFLADWLSVGRESAAFVLGAIATALTAPFLATAQTRLYIDLRLRKDESISPTPSGPPEPF
jgi:hypothetical protein